MARHRHTWARVQEGCTENPGCWSLGGQKILFAYECPCGLRRETTTHTHTVRSHWSDYSEYFRVVNGTKKVIGKRFLHSFERRK